MGLLQIHIHIEVPSEIAVTAKLNSSGDLNNTIRNSSDGYSYSFKVQYLPPVVLTCLLPKSYPSHLPPYFTLSIWWLDSIRILNLCSMLDSIWKEQIGQEVIYQWVEWLHSSSLSYLGFDREIMLDPYGDRLGEDRRAVSKCVSPDVDVPFIRRYNDERLHENFQKNLHKCCICFSEYAGKFWTLSTVFFCRYSLYSIFSYMFWNFLYSFSLLLRVLLGTEFVRLPCLHFFCFKCMKSYSNTHVKEGTISKLQCPGEKCMGMIPPSVLKRLLGDEEYEQWELLMLRKSLESMSDAVYCPRCESLCTEDADQHAQCSKCFFSFCTLCKDRRHVGVECMTPELKLKILEVNFVQLYSWN